MHRILGIDQSFSSTGVCVLEANLKTSGYRVIYSGCITTDKVLDDQIMSDISRSNIIREQIDEIIDKFNVNHIGIEGLSYASSSRANRSLSILFGALIAKQAPPIHVVPPTTLKKFATGKGNASKNKMLEAVQAEYPIFHNSLVTTNVTKGVNDIVDAFWVAKHTMEKIYGNNTDTE